jgi:hypothetical protein
VSTSGTSWTGCQSRSSRNPLGGLGQPTIDRQRHAQPRTAASGDAPDDSAAPYLLTDEQYRTLMRSIEDNQSRLRQKRIQFESADSERRSGHVSIPPALFITNT